jgi:hypothetical protein
MLKNFEWNWLGKLWVGVGGIEVLLLGIGGIWILLILLSGDKSERVMISWIIFSLIMLSIFIGLGSLLLGAVTWAFWGLEQALWLMMPTLIIPIICYLIVKWKSN